MGHQNQRPGEFQKCLFQNFQRRDIQIVGGFIEQQHIRRLQHQVGNQHPSLLPTGKQLHFRGQLIRLEQEPLRPSGHMNHLSAVIDHVVFGPKGGRQLIVGIQRAPVLAEGDHPQVHRPLDGSRIGFQGSRHQPQQRRLAGAVGPQQTNPLTRREDQIQVVEERLAPHRLGDRMQRQQTLGFSFGGFK